MHDFKPNSQPQNQQMFDRVGERMRFNLGDAVVLTRGVAEFMGQLPEPFATFQVQQLLIAHCTLQQGVLDDEDHMLNIEAVNPHNPTRVFSAFEIFGRKVWVITEWDRSVTTILWPDEY
jgi:hypothetical protein